MHTLGKINFDSVVVIDFGERLKSVLSSFMFSDVSSNEVNFFTINQWFDETFFNENAMQNLHFPSIDFENLKKFNKKFFYAFNEKPNKKKVTRHYNTNQNAHKKTLKTSPYEKNKQNKCKRILKK